MAARDTQYRAVVIELEGVLCPAGEPLKRPEGLPWLPILSGLLEPWPDVWVIVTTSRGTNLLASELPQLLGPLARRLLGHTFGMKRGDGVEAAVAVVNGQQLEHLVVVLDATDLPCHRLNILLCDPQQGISAVGIRDAIAQWLMQTAPSGPYQVSSDNLRRPES
jgi:hypothetical protein